MRTVSMSLSPFIMIPIIAAPLNRRPSAAVATGVRLCATLAFSAIPRDVMAKALINSSAAVARTI